MSHHHADKAEKKHKKLAQLLQMRRRHNAMDVEEAARGRDLEQEREEEEKKSLRAGRANAAIKSKKDAAEPAWSARMQQIRDKNTGRTREAKERWNRFAGTESGGGRGL